MSSAAAASLAVLAACGGKAARDDAVRSAPRRVVDHVADPDVLALDGRFLLVGTGSTVDLPFYASNDLESFALERTYDPSALDPAFDYCFLWAPDLSRDGDRLVLYFSGHRVAQGAPCPPASGQDVATFVAVSPDLGLDFGPAAPIDLGDGRPHTRIESGCPAAGCNRAIRIDASVYGEGDERRLFYTWFDRGNNVSSISLAAPDEILDHTGPAIAPAPPAAEEGINEGVDLLARDGRLYLFFSTAHYDSAYSMSYLVADRVEELTRARPAHRLSRAARRRDGTLVRNGGHSSVVEHGGAYWSFFHVGEFDAAGRLAARHVERQRLNFRADGTLYDATAVTLRWGGSGRRAIDVVTIDGREVASCVDADLLAGATSYEFAGVCPGAGDALVHKGEIAAFRLVDGEGARAAVAVPYDGFRDELALD